MTVNQAMAKWGVSKSAIIKRCKEGTIPGVMWGKVTPKQRCQWIIPDDAEKPTDFVMSHARFDRTCSGKNLRSAAGKDPVAYVWSYQGTATIGQLAEKLGVTVQRVKELYEEGFSRYLAEEAAANE